MSLERLSTDTFGDVQLINHDRIDFTVDNLYDVLRDGRPEDLPKAAANRLSYLPEHDHLLMRWNVPVSDNFEEAAETMRWYSKEVQQLRGVGMAVVRHASFVVETTPQEDRPGAAAYTIVENMPDVTTLETNLHNDDRRSRAVQAKVGKALLRYFDLREGQSFVSDITLTEQYAADGTLIDLDPNQETGEPKRQAEMHVARQWSKQRRWWQL